MQKNYFSKELSTERLILRKFISTDAKEIFNILKDKEVAATTLNLPFPCSYTDSQQIIQKYLDEETSNKAIRWAIIDKKRNAFMGGIRLVPNFYFNSGEMGFWIGKAHWRKGFTFEAAKKVIHFGFYVMKLNRIEAHAMTENHPSIKLLEKLGFEREGYHPELVIKWGEYKDVITFGMLRKNQAKTNPADK